MRGHTYTVGAETCANCHWERIHTLSDRADLQAEIVRLRGLTAPALEKQVQQQTQDLDEMHATVRALRADLNVLYVVAGLVFLLGIEIGYAVTHRRNAKKKEAPRQ